MSTPNPEFALASALEGVDERFRNRIVGSYLDLKKAQLEERIEPAGLAAGKFCESVLRHLQNVVLGSATPFNRRIENFADECRRLIAASSSAATESERVIIPRALVFIYTMRNKRGIGHVGGDVDANRIDSALLASSTSWVLCELIRVHHGLSLEEAQDLVDALAVRELPMIWEVAGRKRVLIEGMPARDQVLLLLYSTAEAAVLVEDLQSWVEYRRLDHFKDRVIKPLHQRRFVEYDRQTDTVHLSPNGAREVEVRLLERPG